MPEKFFINSIDQKANNFLFCGHWGPLNLEAPGNCPYGPVVKAVLISIKTTAR